MTSTRIALVALALSSSTTCLAQHLGDVLTQSVDGRLTSVGQRVFAETFDSYFALNNPGWNSLAAGSPALPPGTQPLPPNTDLEWDFLPMKIDGAVSNLFYWNGIGQVTFGSLPGASYEFGMQTKSDQFVLVHGMPELVPGGVVDNTKSLGEMHVHRFWYLDDGDGNLATDPVNGIYLAALRTRMTGLDRSAPLFVLFRALATPAAALTSATAWTQARIGELVPDFAGDFDGDLDVDGLDFLTWQRGLGSAGAAALQVAGDANFDSAIDAADLAVWESQYGSSLATFAGSSGLAAVRTAPEPDSMVLAIVAIIAASLRLARRRSVRSRLFGARMGAQGALVSVRRVWYFWRN